MTSNGLSISVDQKIGDSSYTLGWLLKTLSEHDREWSYGSDINSLTKPPEFNRISNDKGHASIIYGVALTAGEHLYRVCIKFPTDFHLKEHFENEHKAGKITKEELETQVKENFDLISFVHNRELAFYKLATEKFQGLRCPKFVYGEEMTENQEGCILMEDFTGRCAKDVFQFDGLTKNQVLPFVEDLARMQCQSIDVKNLKETFELTDLLTGAVGKYVIICADVLKKRELDWFNEEVYEKIVELTKREKVIELLSAEPEKYGMPSVMVHGDLWPGNILWQKKEGQSEVEMLSIVDWQACRAGSFTMDLGVLMGVSMDGETRRSKEHSILEYFYEKLKEFAEKFAPEGSVDLTFEQLQKSYEKSRCYALLPMIMTIVFNPTEDTPKDGEAEGCLTRRLRFLLEDVFGK